VNVRSVQVVQTDEVEGRANRHDGLFLNEISETHRFLSITQALPDPVATDVSSKIDEHRLASMTPEATIRYHAVKLRGNLTAW